MASGDEALKGNKYQKLYHRGYVSARWRNEFAALIRLELKVGRT